MEVERGFVRPGRLWRSDVPLQLGAGGRAALAALGLRSTLDLREPIERQLDPADLDGLDLNRLEQPIIDGDVKLARGMSLSEIYEHLLEHRAQNLTAAVRSLAAPGALPAVVFCSAGKDRTGLVAALVLGAIGVPDAAIMADFAITEQSMQGSFREAIVARSLAAGVTEQEELTGRVAAPPELMGDTLSWLRARHGGPSGFLRSHGMADAQLATLREALIEPRASRAG